jgi:hypothetical protein
MTEERRKHPRVTVLPASLRVTRAQPYAVVAIIDLSIGGMKVELEGDAPKFGELLDITMAGPSGDVQLNAMVRHVAAGPVPKHHLVGVEFDDPELVDTIAGEWIRRALGDDETTPVR